MGHGAENYPFSRASSHHATYDNAAGRFSRKHNTRCACANRSPDHYYSAYEFHDDARDIDDRPSDTNYHESCRRRHNCAARAHARGAYANKRRHSQYTDDDSKRKSYRGSVCECGRFQSSNWREHERQHEQRR